MRAIAVAALTCAALTTLPLSAHADPDNKGRCLRPIPSLDYAAERFTASATIEAGGCPTREQRRFPITVRIVRTDDNGTDEVARTRWCGPFRPTGADVTYSCAIDLAMTHDPEESAGYHVEITFPGPDGDETAAMEFGCRSNPEETDCEPAGMGDEH